MENITSEKEMIRPFIVSPPLHLASLYKVRYVNPKTGLVLKGYSFLEGGEKKRGREQYLYNSEWVYREKIPAHREHRRLKESSVEFFMRKLKENMKTTNKDWIKQKRELLGVNEFEDKWNCADKVTEHFNKQVEKYGYKCPITHIDFTTIRKMERIRLQRNIASNISADRLFNHINYTKQNVIFTSTGWNIARQNFSFEDLKKLFPREFVERYYKIVTERFPNKIMDKEL